MQRTFTKRQSGSGPVPLKVSDLHSASVPKLRSYWLYGERFYELEGIRVIFLTHEHTLLPRRVEMPRERIFDDEETIINVYDWLSANVPGVQHLIVSASGHINPNGHTKIKNVKFPYRKQY